MKRHITIFGLLAFFPSIYFSLTIEVPNPVNPFDDFNVTGGGATANSTKGPDFVYAKQYVYLTGASYCGNTELTDWSCTYCKKATGQKFYSVIENSTVNTKALVTVNSVEEEIVVTFRGSYNVANFLEDATLVKVDSGDLSKTIMVHRGFLAATLSIYPGVVKNLADLLDTHKDYKVVITGHGLGASMASITLYMIRKKLNVPSNFKPPPAKLCALYTYGQPRTGNQAYADFWNSRTFKVTRVVSKNDLVPHIISTRSGYFHHASELWITDEGDKIDCNKNVYEDPKCSNSKGPVYYSPDHLKYWDVDYKVCAEEGALAVLKKIAHTAVPISTR